MNNTKRAIMVPVMTLAVCAIAMVGLGFALTTSVTSNSNNVEYYMIDISDTSTLDGIPSGNHVNGLFNVTLQSETLNGSVKYKLDSKEAYIRAFSNATPLPDSKLYVTSGNEIGTDKNIKSIKMTLYDNSKNPVAFAEMTSGEDAVFKNINNQGEFSFVCNTTYSLKVTQIVDKNNNTIGLEGFTTEGQSTSIAQNTSLVFTFKAMSS